MSSFPMPKTAAEAGARLYDSYSPGWYRKIDLGKLSMRSSTWCVTGQIAKSRDLMYSDVLGELTRHLGWADDVENRRSVERTYGLDGPDYIRLDRAWRQEIENRLARDGSEQPTPALRVVSNVSLADAIRQAAALLDEVHGPSWYRNPDLADLWRGQIDARRVIRGDDHVGD